MVAHPIWVFVDAHEAMESDGKVGDANRLNNGKNHRSFYYIARRVLSMRFEGTDVKVGEIPCARSQRLS